MSFKEFMGMLYERTLRSKTALGLLGSLALFGLMFFLQYQYTFQTQTLYIPASMEIPFMEGDYELVDKLTMPGAVVNNIEQFRSHTIGKRILFTITTSWEKKVTFNYAVNDDGYYLFEQRYPTTFNIEQYEFRDRKVIFRGTYLNYNLAGFMLLVLMWWALVAWNLCYTAKYTATILLWIIAYPIGAVIYKISKIHSNRAV